MFIKNLKDIKIAINKNLKGTIYRVVNRETLNGVGIEKIIDNYVILSINDSSELKLIRKNINVFCIEEHTKAAIMQQSKKADDIFSFKYAIDYLKKEKGDKYFLLYKITKILEDYCKKNKDWKILNISDKNREKLENKILFSKILKKTKIKAIPNVIVYLKGKEQLNKIARKFKDMVIQTSDSFSGFGTMVVKREDKIDNVIKNFKNNKIKVSKFINGPLLSCTGCATKFGILVSPIRYQIVGDSDITTNKYSWCGNDWDVDDLDEKTQEYAHEVVKRIGDYLIDKYKYKGEFGIDFVLDNRKKILYPLELNPRLLGTTQMYTSLQLEHKEPPLIGFHILEFLGTEYKLSLKEMNRNLKKKKKGAQIILRNKFKKNIVIKKTLKPGVYKMEESKLIFIKDGYCLQHIKNKKSEFVITAIPKKGKVFEKDSQIIRIQTYEKVLEMNNTYLNNKYKNICAIIYEEIL
jgi:hypothetical protein